MDFESAVKNAESQLGVSANQNSDTPMFRGIGYALLALALSVKELAASKAAPKKTEGRGIA